ncbi:MAG: damage-inducible protein CinA [Rhodobacteraceae bacterium]|nr:MAG: damage-inducible protein CinA [Paracoccaceae bacterium]
MQKTAQSVLNILRAKGWKLATAESCTGGMISSALVEIAGSSDVFDRGFVTYSNQAKIDMLGVSTRTLRAHGAVSTETAAEMATGALQNAKTDIAVSVTGVAGPGASATKPEGRVCFGLAQKGKDVKTFQMDFGTLGRTNVRQESAQFALNMILDATK